MRLGLRNNSLYQSPQGILPCNVSFHRRLNLDRLRSPASDETRRARSKRKNSVHSRPVTKYCEFPMPALSLSQRGEDRFSTHILMSRYQSKNPVERTYSKRIVIRNGDAMMRWVFRLENDVAACLMNLVIAPVTTDRLNRQPPTKSHPVQGEVESVRASVGQSNMPRWRQSRCSAVLPKWRPA